MEPCTFRPSSKNKRNPLEENLVHFRKRKPQKIFLVFSQKKTFLYFGKRDPGKMFLYFRKRDFQSSKNENKTHTLLKCCFTLGN